jgi:predicted nucleic acid-binding protein
VIVLDTNVISELLRPDPEPRVMRWFTAWPRSRLFTTTITRSEVLYGIHLMARGRRRDGILEAARAIFEIEMAGRILSFDNDASDSYAQIAAGRRLAGRPISQFDALIAAVAHSRGARLATRNIKDFEDCDVVLINPWASS